jgi:hypothetical protein
MLKGVDFPGKASKIKRARHLAFFLNGDLTMGDKSATCFSILKISQLAQGMYG